MTKKTSQEIERHYFEQFSRTYALPVGHVEYADKPDIRLNGERTIGVEITGFYLRSGQRLDSEQQQRLLRQGVVADAQALYLDAGGRKIELTFNFDIKHPITLARRKALPKALANWLGQVDSRPSGQIARSLYQASMPEFSFIHLNATEYEGPVWRIAQPNGVGLMSGSALEDIVRGKETKSAEYAKCDAYWLLVVVDWIDPAQEQEIRVDDIKISSSIFEKIIVYKPHFEHIVEVQG